VTTEHSIDPAVLTTREAARYCGYSSPAGLLSARRRGMVEANGRRGGNGRLTWERAKLDEFLKGRGPVGRPRRVVASNRRYGLRSAARLASRPMGRREIWVISR
jgi:hypothetical protein